MEQQAINEVGRAIVTLPNSPHRYPWENDSVIALAIDRSEFSFKGSIVGSRKRNLGYLSGYQIVPALCEDRAQRCVDKALVVEGKAISPENYIGLWRAAKTTPITLEEVFRIYGIRLVASFSGPVDRMVGKKSRRNSESGLLFDDLLQKYAKSGDVDSQYLRTFKLSIDYCGRDGPWDAVTISEMLSGELGHDSELWTGELCGIGEAPPLQAGLALDLVEV